MKKQMIVYSLALALVVLGLAGTAFAHWQKMITVEGRITTGTVDWEWSDFQSVSDVGLDWWNDPINPTWPPWQGDKDVGSSSIYLVDGREELTMTNVYPGYAIEVRMHPHYTGSVPGIVRKVLIKDCVTHEVVCDLSYGDSEAYIYDDQRNPIFHITWGEAAFPQFAYCKKWELSFVITALEDIVQDKYDTPCAEYCYYWELEVVNYNEWPDPCPYNPDPDYVPPYVPPYQPPYEPV